MSFENKLVAVLNKKIETGVAMNALAHMTIGLGAQLNNDMLRLNDYLDKEGNAYPNISQMPFMILRGKNVRSVKLPARPETKRSYTASLPTP